MVQRTNRNPNRNGIHSSFQDGTNYHGIYGRIHMCIGTESKRENRQIMNFDENHSSSFLTIIDGDHDIVDQIGLLKFNVDVFKRTTNCQRYYQNVFRYKHEISEQQSAQVESLIDIITPEVRFNKGLKLRSSYSIRIRLTNSESVTRPGWILIYRSNWNNY